MNISETDKKKVLLTVNNNRLSGIEKFTFLLAEYLNKDKYSVRVGVPTYGPLCELFEKNEVEYFIFNNGRNESHSIKGICNLFNHIRKYKYDIVHAQAGIAPCMIAKFLGVKLILEHKHGLDFTDEQIKNMNIVKLYYERTKKYFTDYTLTGCAKDKLVLQNKFKYRENTVITVYNGLENTNEIFKKVNGNKFIIGTIGRLTFQKGQEYFIEMAKNLSDENKNFEFHIYGEGENYESYNKLIKNYGIEEKVFLKGYTNNVSEIMNTFDLFVLTSRYEGIPYVILEAMRNSVPVITTDVGGISEVIQNMYNGILVEKENVKELFKFVKLLSEDKNLCNELTVNAKKDFEEKYTIEKTIDFIEKIYESKEKKIL